MHWKSKLDSLCKIWLDGASLQLCNLHARASTTVLRTTLQKPSTKLCLFKSPFANLAAICLLAGWAPRLDRRLMSASVTLTALLCTTPRPKPNGVGPLIFSSNCSALFQACVVASQGRLRALRSFQVASCMLKRQALSASYTTHCILLRTIYSRPLSKYRRLGNGTRF